VRACAVLAVADSFTPVAGPLDDGTTGSGEMAGLADALADADGSVTFSRANRRCRCSPRAFALAVLVTENRLTASASRSYSHVVDPFDTVSSYFRSAAVRTASRRWSVPGRRRTSVTARLVSPPRSTTVVFVALNPSMDAYCSAASVPMGCSSAGPAVGAVRKPVAATMPAATRTTAMATTASGFVDAPLLRIRSHNHV